MTSAAVQRNPYIIGRPITEPHLFFGRETLFEFIEDNLRQAAKVVLLYGQRRIGKSSILFQIPHFLGREDFAFVPFDLQDKSQLRLSEILAVLMTDTVDTLSLPETLLPAIAPQASEKESYEIFQRFLSQVVTYLKGRRLVFLLDEFDVLSHLDVKASGEHFFLHLRSVLSRQDQVAIIPVVGRRLDDTPKLLGLFKGAPSQEIGLLDQASAERLITLPAEGVLSYDLAAIQMILELTAGHPYFIQVLCFALFVRARDEQRWRVTQADVESCIDKAIEIGEGGLAWFRDGLPTSDRVVFAAVAEAQSQALSRPPGTPVEEPLSLLETYGVIATDALLDARDRLLEWDFLQEIKEPESSTTRLYNYQVTIELVRRWLLKRHSLHREIWELQHTDLRAEDAYERALALNQQHSRAAAIPFYEQALSLNPNHFGALFDLAELYLETQAFGKAVALYQRAYRIDPVRTDGALVQSLLGYGQQLIEQGKMELAEEQFRQALALHDNRQSDSVKEQIKELSAALQHQSLFSLELTNWPGLLQQVFGLQDKHLRQLERTLTDRHEYQKKLQLYRKTLEELMGQESHLNHKHWQRLHQLQQSLGLRTDDVKRVEQTVMSERESLQHENRGLYRSEVERIASRGKISAVGRQILEVRRQELGLSLEAAAEIEAEVGKVYQETQNNLQIYENTLAAALREEHPLSETTQEELKHLQSLLGLSDQEATQIQTRLLS